LSTVFWNGGSILKKFVLLALAAWLLTPSFCLAAPADDPTLRGGSRNIGDEELEPKDPILATTFSVLPGVIFHGFGSYYAGDTEFGNKMLVTEIAGAGISIWGYSLIHEPDKWDPYFGGTDNARQAGYWVEAGGVTLLVASWIGDVANASDAATTWNNDHQMQFQMDSYYGTGVRLAMAEHF
jgi:hypothetical protein